MVQQAIKSKGLGFSSQHPQKAHDGLEFQFEGIRCPPLECRHHACTWSMHIHTCEQTHKIKISNYYRDNKA